MTGRMQCLSCQKHSTAMATATATPIITHLPFDLQLLVFGFVQPTDLIRGVSRVSRRLSALVRDERLWRSHCRELSGWSEKTPLTLHQMQRCCVYASARRRRSDAAAAAADDEPPPGPPSALRPVSLLPSREFAAARRRSARVCLATTTDRENEILENALPSSEDSDDDWDVIASADRTPEQASRPAWPMGQEGTYWSSAASASDSDEVLLFATRCPVALISDVAIKPFKELSFFGIDEEKAYTWPGVVVRVYRLPVGARALGDPNRPIASSGFPCVVSADTRLRGGRAKVGWDAEEENLAESAVALGENAPQRRLIAALLAGHEPVYESPMHKTPPPDSDAWQHFPLPPLVVGNVITFTLVGKNHRQFPTSGFYVCVDKVAARGIPLFSDREQAKSMEQRFRGL